MISAVVAAYRQPGLLAETVDMLRSQSRPPDEIIVVDDSDAERRSGGFAKNKGVRQTRHDVILLCDHDQYLMPDAVESLERSLYDWEAAAYKNVIVNLVRVDVPQDLDGGPEGILGACRSLGLLDDEELTSDVLSTELCLCLMRRRTYEYVGGYDTDRFPMYGLCNQDFVLRARKLGCLVTSHVPRISTGKRLYSMDRWHEGKAKYQEDQAWQEFRSKYGMDYEPSRIAEMVRHA